MGFHGFESLTDRDPGGVELLTRLSRSNLTNGPRSEHHCAKPSGLTPQSQLFNMFIMKRFGRAR